MGKKQTAGQTPIRIAPTAKWITLRVRAEDASFIRALDAQRDHGKPICGAAFSLSEKAAAEKAAAEKAAAEKAAAEKAAAEKAAAEKAAAHVWELSARERLIVAALGNHDDC
jgi:colicin import membrane protein